MSQQTRSCGPDGWQRSIAIRWLRYPTLQVPLGTALATIPESGLQPYVDSIRLSAIPSESRRSVAVCLRAFQSAAPLARRQQLWELAHERWLRWDFGLTDPNERLTRIGYSELDYALVGFAVECLGRIERADRDCCLREQLSSLTDQWHASHVHFLSESFRILSLRQPYAQADALNPGEDWLREGSYFLPLDPKFQRYEAMQYGMAGG